MEITETQAGYGADTETGIDADIDTAADTGTGITIPSAFLSGVPTSLLIDGTPARRADEIDAGLRLFMGNRPEHFRPLAETVPIGDRELRVFEWTRSGAAPD